jgi:hypothetical protein
MVFVGKTEETRSIGRPMLRCGDNIRIDLTERVWMGTVWIYLDKDRNKWWGVVNMVMNLWVP